MVKKLLGVMALLLIGAPLAAQFNRSRTTPVKGGADVERFRDSWRVLEPITRRNLSIYPVVSSLKADTQRKLLWDNAARFYKQT